MTYEGSESYKTIFGACLSIIVGFMILSFIAQRVFLLTSKEKIKTSKDYFVTNLENEPPFYAHKDGFNFAFTANQEPDERYGAFHLYYVYVKHENKTKPRRIKLK